MERPVFRFLLSLALLLGVLPSSASANAVNLFANPGFETTTPAYDGWITFGSGIQLSTPGTDNIFRSGAAAAKAYGEFTGCPGPGAFTVGGFFQEFTPTPGKVYELSGYSYVSSSDPVPGTSTCNGNRMIAKIVFYNAAVGGSEISANEVVIGDWNSALDAWVPFTVSAPCPAGAMRVEALFLFLQPACDTGSVFVDDTFFCEVTPSPDSNVLANPSFDAGIGSWLVFGNAVPESRSYLVYSSPGSAKLFGPFSAPGDASGMYQQFATSPNQVWRLSVYALNTCRESPVAGTNDNLGIARIVFRDAVNAEVGSNEVVVADNTSNLGLWKQYSVTAAAPAGAVTAEAYLLFVQPTDPLLGGAMWVDDAAFDAIGTTDAGGTGASAVRLAQNVPNPFTQSTTIQFQLSRSQEVELDIYDAAGRHVANLLRGDLEAGPHQVSWDGRSTGGVRATPGVYHYVLKTGEGVQARKLILSSPE